MSIKENFKKYNFFIFWPKLNNHCVVYVKKKLPIYKIQFVIINKNKLFLKTFVFLATEPIK